MKLPPPLFARVLVALASKILLLVKVLPPSIRNWPVCQSTVPLFTQLRVSTLVVAVIRLLVDVADVVNKPKPVIEPPDQLKIPSINISSTPVSEPEVKFTVRLAGRVSVPPNALLNVPPLMFRFAPGLAMNVEPGLMVRVLPLRVIAPSPKFQPCRRWRSS